MRKVKKLTPVELACISLGPIDRTTPYPTIEMPLSGPAYSLKEPREPAWLSHVKESMEDKKAAK